MHISISPQQDARTPGRPCDEVKRTYRLKYDKLNTRLVCIYMYIYIYICMYTNIHLCT